MINDQHDDQPLPPEIMNRLEPDRLPDAGVERELMQRLRDDGLLSSGRRRSIWRTTGPIWVAALAAGIAFAAGMLVGATRGAGQAVTANTSVIAASQQYAAALSHVDPGQDSSKAAALASFRLVLDEFNRLAPDNEGVAMIVAVLEGSALRGPLVAKPVDASRSFVVWH